MGLLNVSPEEYHSLPGLSPSIAKVLLARSPLHAKCAAAKKPTKAMDRGTAGHTFLLGKGKRIACLPYDDWRTKAAKDSRDKTREAGMVPMLHDDYTEAEELAASIKSRLVEEHAKDDRVPAVLDGASEQAVSWVESSMSGPVPCRGMMDHVWFDGGCILDLKLVEDASPRAIERIAENLGYAIQACAYTRGLAASLPGLAGRIRFLFLFVEVEPPFAINIVEPDGVFREIGERRWRRAVEIWGRCMATNEWPAYGSGIKKISPPAWALSREGCSQDEL